MAVSTIRGKDNTFSTIIIYFLGVLGIALIVFFGGEILRNLAGLGGTSGLTVEVVSGEAEVYVDNKFIGKTPLESKDIKSGNNVITIKNSLRQYQTSIKFLPSKKSMIHAVGIIRDLGTSDLFSSGQEFWFDRDNPADTLRIVSEPSGATVSIDGSEVGKTPFTSSIIPSGDYELGIAYPGYESQTARINVQKGYTLNGSIKMFPYPTPSIVKVFEGSQSLFDLSIDNEAVTSDTQAWVKGLLYWNTNRGINLDGVGENKDRVFDYFIDYKGGIYNLDGNPVTTQQEFESLKDLKRGAYLGRVSDGIGLTKEAKDALNTLSQYGVTATKTATIKATPLGWLRVRDSSSLNATEISRVNAGETFSVLEETEGWIKIRVSDTIEGWVSSSYVQISE